MAGQPEERRGHGGHASYHRERAPAEHWGPAGLEQFDLQRGVHGRP